MTTKLRTLLIFGAALLLAGCGSDSDETAGGDAPAAKSESKAAEENLWATFEAAPTDADTPPFDHSFTAPPPIARPDPDEVLARYEKDCADDADSADCRALRREVERVFLDALIGLRDAGQVIDADVLRAAAAAETPQLACIGLRDRLREGKRSEADWELIAAALDNQWRAPRNAALSYARIVQPDDPQAPPRAIKMLEREGARDYRGPTDICLDGWRDPLPNPGLSGRYPNARYRPFASDATRRWFTTTDSPEKVFAYLAKAGYPPAQTADELKAAISASYMEAMTKMTSGDAEDAQKSMEEMMRLAMRQGIDWSRDFTNLTGTGEIRYVMVTPNQAIAVFKDDYLDATSIVAPAPPVIPDAAFDVEVAKRDAYARSVFGF